ncbi:LOW QUALITY PROTEIN: suppressor of cytokine signaling 3 [Takifugu rubripes]|uniref:LOW QUALITY PROTEIN: suppressor of cytokine signaling 3 n=1 Tax=Takifugu rubripes TaxID=31033 RepID=UPI003D30A4BD
MVTFNGPKALAMSSVRSADARVQGSNFTPHHFKPFSSNEHYQQVMRALRKLQESGFYWGAMGGREASSTLRSEPPGTFLIRDSSDHHHFFTLSVQTARGTKNLRIHSEGGGFFLQPDPQNAHELPQFDCVLKLIAHYMGKGSEAGGRGGAGACGGDPGGAEMKARSVYLIHTGGERIPLELRRPLLTSLSSLQHLCRTTLNNRGLGRSEQSEQLPHTIKDYLEEYDAPI